MATHSSVLSCIIPGTGAWWATVYGVAQSWTQLTWLSSSSSCNLIGADTLIPPWLSRSWQERGEEYRNGFRPVKPPWRKKVYIMLEREGNIFKEYIVLSPIKNLNLSVNWLVIDDAFGKWQSPGFNTEFLSLSLLFLFPHCTCLLVLLNFLHFTPAWKADHAPKPQNCFLYFVVSTVIISH